MLMLTGRARRGVSLADRPGCPEPVRPGRARVAVGILPGLQLTRVLPGEALQLAADLLTGVPGDGPGAVGICAVHQLGCPGKLRVEPDEPLGQELTTSQPGLADRAGTLVVLGQPVYVLDGLADPLETADEPDPLGLQPLAAGLEDGLPGVPGSGQRGNGGDCGRQIANHRQEIVHSGHNCIMASELTSHSRLAGLPSPRRRRGGPASLQPRPMNGIVVAVMVRNWTLAVSGREAM
jgi:hypothetical protein